MQICAAMLSSDYHGITVLPDCIQNPVSLGRVQLIVEFMAGEYQAVFERSGKNATISLLGVCILHV